MPCARPCPPRPPWPRRWPRWTALLQAVAQGRRPLRPPPEKIWMPALWPAILPTCINSKPPSWKRLKSCGRRRWSRQLDGELSSLRHEFSETVDRLQGELDEQQQKKLAQTHAQLENAHNKISAITSSRSWRLTRPLRITGRLAYNARSRKVWLPHRWPGQLSAFRASVRTRGWREALVQLQQLPSAPPSPPAAPQIPDSPPGFRLDPVSVEPCNTPVASIVVPVYNKVEYTASCLNSVVEHTDMGRAEIIVVDDASSDGTADWLARCSGIRVMTNQKNSGSMP